MGSVLVAITLIIVTLYNVQSTTVSDLASNVNHITQDGRLHFCELARKRGLKCVQYNVPTQDGYILGLFNIVGDRKKPVYLQHGLIDSCDSFIIGNQSLVTTLASKGYDLWLGNMRGNKYSKKHKILNPNASKFWEFSFDEIGTRDLPALIDFVLKTTGQRSLQAIGHSYGASVFYIMCSTKPEYNGKIKVLISLGPMVYMNHYNAPIFFALRLAGMVGMSPYRGHGEILNNSTMLVKMMKEGASPSLMGYSMGRRGFFLPFSGDNSATFSPAFLREALGHYPAGSSTKTVAHAMQFIVRKKFAKYDYGVYNNLMTYRSMEPPEYHLKYCVAKNVLVVGLHDKLSDVGDVKILRSKLPHVVEYHEIGCKSWNHLDYVWGTQRSQNLFGYLCDVLKRYR